MARRPLPELDGTLMLTDTGVETDIVFHVGRDLPDFALYPLLDDDEGRAILERYYSAHLAVAAEHGLGYSCETPSWRSTPSHGLAAGYSQADLDRFDREGLAFLRALVASTGFTGPVTCSGMLGPRGDGYVAGAAMTAAEAEDYHRHQVEVLADAGADLVTGLTLTYADEGLGMARAAEAAGVPVRLSFTLETDGRLPDGSALADVVRRIDDETDGYVVYYGINCVHPDHLAPVVSGGEDWTSRIGMLRANASRMSHAELDVAEELDEGDPVELAGEYAALREVLPSLTVLGGCCGTDVRHVRAIASAVSVG